MNSRWRLVALAPVIILGPSAALAFDYETVELMDLPDNIRHDIYRYILNNVDTITNPGAPALVQRSSHPDHLVVKLKYGYAAVETLRGPIWIICTYSYGKRQRCFVKDDYQGQPVDPPLPEFQQPLVPYETRSNTPLEGDRRCLWGAPAPQLGR